ncbi:MAG: PorT family protein [Bacteroidales bacterium]|nr:PorT family protein [Bacteroidales bacterium]MCL2738969.1 PorT family protein [Bacteroidales bacterium]
MKTLPKCVMLPMLLFAGTLSAQTVFPQVQTAVYDTLYLHEFNISPQIGTDMGGAVPVPFSAGGSKINAYPRLSPSIGIAVNYTYRYRWNLGIELTYKRIAMDADARVTNQKFKGENALQYFSGTARMHMAFTLLEVPFYAKYMFGSHRQHSVILGGYFAYNLYASFESIAKKGFNGPEPDVVESVITEPMVMDFSPVLDSWDAGVLLGYEARVYNRVHVGFRVLAGFKDIFVPNTDFFDYKMYPMRGAIVLHYDLLRFGRQRLIPPQPRPS